jgi:hypothetical protein
VVVWRVDVEMWKVVTSRDVDCTRSVRVVLTVKGKGKRNLANDRENARGILYYVAPVVTTTREIVECDRGKSGRYK